MEVDCREKLGLTAERGKAERLSGRRPVGDRKGPGGRKGVCP